MSSGEENCSESPTMESIEESKPHTQHSVSTPWSSNIPSNPPASPPQALIASNSSPPPLPAVPQPPSAMNSTSHAHSVFTSPPPPLLQRFANNQDDSYFNSFPPGYRFCPYDHELVLNYLSKKIYGLRLPRNRIIEVNLYEHDPEFFADRYSHHGEKQWFFFTPRDRKYKNGKRPSRAAGDGYWKATGADKKITYGKPVVGAGDADAEGTLIGYRKALVYYTGKPPKGSKTNWIMHEYRVNDPPPPVRKHRDDMRLDDWVLCRIYKKAEKRTNVNDNVENQRSNEEIDEDYINYDHNPNDPAALEIQYAGEILDMINDSLETSSPVEEVSKQQTDQEGSNYFYPAPPNHGGVLQDTQIPGTFGTPVPTDTINPHNWGHQDEFLNPVNCSQWIMPDPFFDHYSCTPVNLPTNPSPLVNLGPMNTAPPTGSLPPMNTAPPTGSLPPTNTAPLRCLPPMNTAPSNGHLPSINTAQLTGLLLPTNPANTAPIRCLPPTNTAPSTGHLLPINTAPLTGLLPPTNPANGQPTPAKMNIAANHPGQLPLHR